MSLCSPTRRHRRQGHRPVEDERRPAPEKYTIVPTRAAQPPAARIMGADPRPARSKYLQSWAVPTSSWSARARFRRTAAYNPTGTVGALTYWGVDAIRSR